VNPKVHPTWILGLCLLLLLVHGVRADILELTNGGRIEGTIVEEREDAILIEVEMGILSFHRSRVASITRSHPTHPGMSTPEESLPKQDTGKASTAPPPLDTSKLLDFRRSLSAAVTQRSTMSQQQRRVRDQENTVNAIESQILALGVEQVQARREMEAFRKYSGQTVPPHIYQAYKAAESGVERIEAEMQSLNRQLKESQNHLADAQQLVNASQAVLFNQLKTLWERYHSLAREGFTDSQLEPFRISLNDLGSVVERQEIQLRRMGNTFFITVWINDRFPVEMILDTGASGVLLDNATANKLGIRPSDTLLITPARIADGSVISRRTFMLKKIQIGVFSVSDIRASAPVNESETDTPLLLGMEFLKHFHFSLDARANRLILERLK
jgi:clan AA aspartic protease (TIGR02281 family)